MANKQKLITRVLLISGPTATGKSATIRRLTRWLRKHQSKRSVMVVAGDEAHTAQAKRRMGAGKPVTDEYRKKIWVPRLEIALQIAIASNPGAIILVDCSALKRWLRNRIRQQAKKLEAEFIQVWLDVPKEHECPDDYARHLEELQRRAEARLKKGKHWVSPAIVPDQIQQFQRPGAAEEPIIVPALGNRKAIRNKVLRTLGYRPGKP